MEGDHYTWYAKMIAMTAHGLGPSLVFAVLFEFTNNPILSYNILYVSNLLLFQLGLYLLVKYYTKNGVIGFVAGFLLPLSYATQMYYTFHLHSFYYWTLPFLLLSVEVLFDRIKSGTYSIRRVVSLLSVIFASLVWLLLAEWHIAIFSLLFLLIFGLFKTRFIFENFRQHYKVFIAFFVTIFLAYCTLIPLALQMLEATNIHHKVRSEYDVSYEARPVTELLFLSIPLRVVVSEVDQYFPIFSSPEERVSFWKAVNSPVLPVNYYPDILTSILFWLVLLLIIPFTLYSIKSKGKFSHEVYLGIILLVAMILGLGPFLKLSNNLVVAEIKLPHHYLFHLLLPLQAIRNINRIFTIGYFAALILFSLLLQRAYLALKHQKAFAYKTVYSYILVTLLLLFGVIINNGWYGFAYPEVKIQGSLQKTFALIREETQGPSDVYYLDQLGTPYFADSLYAYNASYFNYTERNDYINTVIGGIAGLYPEATILDQLEDSDNPKVINEFVSILSAKKVDFVIVRNRDQNSPIIQALKQYYNYQAIDKEYALMRLQTVTTEGVTFTPTYDFIIPKTINKSEPVHIYLNFVNMTDKIYINKEQVAAKKYTFKYIDSKGTTKHEEDHKAGGEPFILPGDGKSVQITNNLKRLSTGEYRVQVYEEGSLIAEETINIVDKIQWQARAESLKSEPIIIEETHFSFRQKETTFLQGDIYVSGKVTQGIINPQNKERGELSQIQFHFVNDTDQPAALPAWLTAYQCTVDSVYTPDDRFGLWCNFHQPSDLTFDTAQIYGVTTPTLLK
jgi:hypothetical protein